MITRYNNDGSHQFPEKVIPLFVSNLRDLELGRLVVTNVPEVDVVVLTYGAEPLIGEAIATVLASEGVLTHVWLPPLAVI